MEKVREFRYLGIMVSAGGCSEAAVTVRTRCQWVKLRKCGKLTAWKEASSNAERACLNDVKTQHTISKIMFNN